MSTFSFNYGVINDMSFEVHESRYTLPETIQILSQDLDGQSYTFTLPYSSQVWNISYIAKPVQDQHIEHKAMVNKLLGV